MREETREAMQLFVEKAERLLSGRYATFMYEQGSHFNLSWVLGGQVEYKQITPDTDTVDALVTTFRMFQQKNDRIALTNMAKISDDPDVSQEWKDHFAFARACLNRYLDGPPYMDLRPEGKTLTGRDIMETFLYGEYAHTTKKYREQYLCWKKEPMMFSLIGFAFDKVVCDMLKTIGYISAVCSLELTGESIPDNPEMQKPLPQFTPLFKAELTPNTEGITAPVIQSRPSSD